MQRISSRSIRAFVAAGLFAVCLMLVLCACPAGVSADEQPSTDVQVSDLTASNTALDGTVVRFTAEAVGEPLAADSEHKWVNVTADDGSSIGVCMSNAQADLISRYGDYHGTGDTLRIKGIYAISCSKHQGELDVHATNVRVVKPGAEVVQMPMKVQIVCAIVLVVIGVVLLLVYVLVRRRHKRGLE